MTHSQKELCAKAGQRISNLDFLTKREEFKEFINQFRVVADKLAEVILHDESIDAQERERMRQHRIGILDVINSPEIDMRANRGILDSFFGPGGNPDE